MIPLLAMLVWLAPPQHVRKPAPHRKPTRRTERRPTGMSPQRARQIQDALIKAGYLAKASGHWDATSIAAMKKFQTDHHWQTRFIPDARALLALGLVQPITDVQTTANGGGS